MDPTPGAVDPETGGEPLLTAGSPTEMDAKDADFGPEDEAPPSSNPGGVTIVVNPYSDMEWLGLGLGVFAFFYIVPYMILNLLDVSLKVLIAIYYPLGTGYILILHQKLEQKDKFRNHWVIKMIDQKDYYCIGYLIGLLCIYAIDHRIQGNILEWLSEIFGSEEKVPYLFYPWNIFLLLVVVSFMVLSSVSVVLISSRKMYVTLRLFRTMLPGQQRNIVLGKGAAIVGLSVLLLVLSRKRHNDGEYHGPPIGGFFWGTCEACLVVSSLAAVQAGVKYLMNHDWTMPSLSSAGNQALARETPE